ncbi:hypothetical protein [Pseudonocardia sp. MH-G8]|uniref:hypothetical protein n=1 Tax=Pseudonocardia sp. MH-G8 TaxID=1854588 RepID=UPI000BA1712B|nr:hypothetical protein [Pseudonocardia sp. MH-G8]OZM76401.1 hypothetical protein CFP66_41455 [Pseudonocardia sp. MH-G8]
MSSGDPIVDDRRWPGRTAGLLLVTVVVLALLGLCQGHSGSTIAPMSAAGATPVSTQSGHSATCVTPRTADAVSAQRTLPGDVDTDTAESGSATARPRSGSIRCAPAAAAVAPHGWELIVLLGVARN